MTHQLCLIFTSIVAVLIHIYRSCAFFYSLVSISRWRLHCFVLSLDPGHHGDIPQRQHARSSKIKMIRLTADGSWHRSHSFPAGKVVISLALWWRIDSIASPDSATSITVRVRVNAILPRSWNQRHISNNTAHSHLMCSVGDYVSGVVQVGQSFCCPTTMTTYLASWIDRATQFCVKGIVVFYKTSGKKCSWWHIERVWQLHCASPFCPQVQRHRE